MHDGVFRQQRRSRSRCRQLWFNATLRTFDRPLRTLTLFLLITLFLTLFRPRQENTHPFFAVGEDPSLCLLVIDLLSLLHPLLHPLTNSGFSVSGLGFLRHRHPRRFLTLGRHPLVPLHSMCTPPFLRSFLRLRCSPFLRSFFTSSVFS